MELENENDVSYLCEECYQAQPLDIQIVIDAYTIGYKMAHKEPDFKEKTTYYQEHVRDLYLKIMRYMSEKAENDYREAVEGAENDTKKQEKDEVSETLSGLFGAIGIENYGKKD